MARKTQIDSDLIKDDETSPTVGLAISSGSSPTVGLAIDCGAILKELSELVKVRGEKTIKIVERLKTLQDNQDALKEQTGLTFTEVLAKTAHVSKSYFYSLVGNYSFLQEQGRLDLLEVLDTKVIEYIEKQEPEKQGELIAKAAQGGLTRKDITPRETSQNRSGGASIPAGDTLHPETEALLKALKKEKTESTQRKFINEIMIELAKAYGKKIDLREVVANVYEARQIK